MIAASNIVTLEQASYDMTLSSTSLSESSDPSVSIGETVVYETSMTALEGTADLTETFTVPHNTMGEVLPGSTVSVSGGASMGLLSPMTTGTGSPVSVSGGASMGTLSPMTSVTDTVTVSFGTVVNMFDQTLDAGDAIKLQLTFAVLSSTTIETTLTSDCVLKGDSTSLTAVSQARTVLKLTLELARAISSTGVVNAVNVNVITFTLDLAHPMGSNRAAYDIAISRGHGCNIRITCTPTSGNDINFRRSVSGSTIAFNSGVLITTASLSVSWTGTVRHTAHGHLSRHS